MAHLRETRTIDRAGKMSTWWSCWLTVLALLSFSLWFPGRFLARWPRARKGTIVAGVNLALLLAAALVVEALLRRAGERPYEKTFPGQQENSLDEVPWARADPELGWTCSPRSGNVNPQGFRDARDFAHLPRAVQAQRVMVLGDSFVWGAGVGAEDTIPARLEAELGGGHEVFNLGVPGFGLDQMVLAYRRHRDDLAPGIVVLVYIDDDLHRVIESFRIAERMNKPSFVLTDGELVPRGAPPRIQLALNALSRRSALIGFVLRHYYARTEALPVARRLFEELAHETRARGESLVVVRIPRREEGSALSALRRWSVECVETLQRESVPFLDTTEELARVADWKRRFYFGDGHLSEEGTRSVAAQLANVLRRIPR